MVALAALAALLLTGQAEGEGTPSATEVAYSAAPTRPAGVSDCPDGLCGAEALEPFFRQLAALERGEGGPVHILQLGDSHTAGDRITGAVRAALQTRFGNAGRGVLPPGLPFAGYGPFQVQMEGWAAPPVPRVAPAGFSHRAGLAGALARPSEGSALTLTAEPGTRLDRVGYCADAGPGSGSVTLSVSGPELDGEWVGTASLDQSVEAVRCETLELPARGEKVVVTTRGGVGLHDIRLAGATPGIMVSSLGVIGATLRDLAGRDEAIISAQLAEWPPALILLAYGVNEGFEDGLDPAAYETLLQEQIARLRRLAPQAAVLVLGAPEGLRTLSARAKHSLATKVCSTDNRRYIPEALPLVRDVQRRVSAASGVAYWDWRGRMGGDCSAERLSTLDEPFMRPDRVHFTSVGADWIGGILSADLTGAYDRWKVRDGGQD